METCTMTGWLLSEALCAYHIIISSSKYLLSHDLSAWRAVCQLSCNMSAQLQYVKQLSAQLPLVKSAGSSVAPCEIRCTLLSQ